MAAVAEAGAGGDGWREPVALANKCGLCQVRAHVPRSCSPDSGVRIVCPTGKVMGLYTMYKNVRGAVTALRVKLKNARLFLALFSLNVVWISFCCCSFYFFPAADYLYN